MTSEHSQPPVPEPTIISSGAISRLNLQGRREEFVPLSIVDECRGALAKMPEGKTGIVIGSGPKTDFWRSRGWRTLDINPETGADIIHDANRASEIVPDGSLDFVYAEAVTMDPRGLTGVSPARLLHQANKALRIGGKLIVETAHFENNPRTTLPDRNIYIKLLQSHGFHGVAELDEIKYTSEDRSKLHQKVVYYGEKMRNGFQDTREK